MAEESKEPEELQTKEVVSETEDKKKKAAGKNRSGATTAILTVPLFIKFVGVLVIKFLMDLIVYPLLFVYRILGRIKRKIFGLFTNSTKEESPNGAAPTSE